MLIFALRDNNSCLKNKNVAETTFDLHFDIVVVHNSFHSIKLISFFKFLSFYSLYCSFPIQNNGKIINRSSNSYSYM